MNRRIWNWFRNGIAFAVLCLVIGTVVSILLDQGTRLDRRNLGGASSSHSAPFTVTLAALDESFEQVWQEQGIEPTGPADPLLIARRLSLSLAGTIPSLEEIRRLEQVPSSERIAWWTDHLLQDKRTSDFLAERLARAWVGVEDGPFLVYRRRRFVTWLSEQLHSNRPYDSLVRDLISATGLWTDKPQVNFLTRTIDVNIEPNNPDPIQLAGRTTRAFLGMRIDCLQCHDDFLGNVNLGTPADSRGGTQHDFHALAAFFHQVENSLTGIRDNQSANLYQVKLLDEEQETLLSPQVPFLPELVDSSITHPRWQLAKWLTHEKNRVFARATVNRVWAIMFGQALIQPVDDIPLEGPFPLALEVLVDDFVEHNFDLHRLIRLIALSRAFALDSSAEFPITEAHQAHWAVFPLTRLRPEQMAGAMLQATRLKTTDATSHILTQLTRFGQQNDFVVRFGDPGENEFEDRGETVTQRLLLFNGDLMSENLGNDLNVPVRLHRISPDSIKTLETVFLSTLTRHPTEAEKKRFCLEEEGETSLSQQTLDLYWSLINSAEFRWNH